MTLHGQSIIAGVPTPEFGDSFHPVNPATGENLEPPIQEALGSLADAAMEAADRDFDEFRAKAPEERAKFLEAIAAGLEGLGDALLQRAHAETALPMARLTAERGRMTMQARLFANLIREGTWLEARIDRAMPDRQPLPKPDVRRMMQPLGPIVVFGASNFPFAISVAGTDTVSALGAGCPVIVKAHPGHPGTCEMVATVISAAAKKTGMPPGVFSMLQGKSNYIGMALAKHPLTCAVAFTGSLKGGRALFDACGGRPRPIPFYGELGSVNPVFLLPGALRERAQQMAEAFVTSLTMGVGQFCTNPGLVFGLKSAEFGSFMDKTASLVKAWQPSTMLHAGISSAFDGGVERVASIHGMRLAAKSEAPADALASQAAATVFITDMKTFSENDGLHEEVFGPTSVVTYCDSKEDLERLAETFDGQLTASIHGTEEDLKENARLVRILERKVGRIIFNGFGTGIEVCPSMHHGGLYPAATHSFFTSIGTAAIYRFVRPVCYQGFPDECLPEPLQNKNANGAWRMVDGKMTNGDV